MLLANLLKQVLDLGAIAPKQTTPSVNVMSYLDSVGVVESPIRIGKKGRVRLCGVYWFARSNSDRIIAIGETIKVISRYGTTLNVEPIDVPRQLNLSWSEPRVCSS
ncbi:MAG: NfeD family protein [Cyanobacteria bacterium P01_B01_bin.77]